MLKDLTLAFRSLSKTPGFTVIALVTLALGIGLNTAMFSLINATLLRPLPFPESDQLVRLYRTTSKNARGGLAPADYLELKRVETGFGLFSAFDNSSVSVSEPGHPAELQNAMQVSADYFAVLKIVPELGRTFRAPEEIRGNHQVVVLSHALWLDRYAGASDVIGRTLRIDGEPHEIIGVLPPSADDGRVIRQARLFRPLSFTDDERVSRSNAWLNVIGRRLPSVSEKQGEAWVATLGSRMAADHSKENAGSGWRCVDLLGATGNSTGRIIMAMLLGLSGFVLLIACSNLANFLLARTMARSHELAVRAALGASRARLLRPLVFESLILALAGCAGALIVAVWAGRWLSAQSVANAGSPMDFPLDWRVLGFALVAALLTALFFGTAPAFFTAQVDVNQALKTGARGATTGRHHSRVRHLLVTGQFTLALILLAGGGFFMRGARNLANQHFGWDVDHVIIGGLELPKSSYAGGPEIIAFQRTAAERLAALPGVTAVSFSYSLPVRGLIGPRTYVIQGSDDRAKTQETSALYNGITPAYFEVSGTRLMRGRAFDAGDTSTSPKVVIINETMARTLFQEKNPLGQRLARADVEPREWAEIVGVVADVKSVGVYQAPAAFQIYHPFEQEPWHYATASIRIAGIAPESLLAPIRVAIAGLDPDLPVRDLMPISAGLERASFDLTMLEKMLGAFALLGLSLAGVGIYGVIAHSVVQRTGEIGIRMALGAQISDVVRLILGSGIRLAVTGAGVGLLGAIALARLIASVMPAMQTDGGWVVAVSGALMVVIAVVAGYVPARHAAKIDPLTALRAD